MGSIMKVRSIYSHDTEALVGGRMQLAAEPVSPEMKVPRWRQTLVIKSHILQDLGGLHLDLLLLCASSAFLDCQRQYGLGGEKDLSRATFFRRT